MGRGGVWVGVGIVVGVLSIVIVVGIEVAPVFHAVIEGKQRVHDLLRHLIHLAAC